MNYKIIVLEQSRGDLAGNNPFLAAGFEPTTFFFSASELRPREDASHDVAEFARRHLRQLQRGLPAQVPQDHPRLRRAGPRIVRHVVSGAGDDQPSVESWRT